MKLAPSKSLLAALIPIGALAATTLYADYRLDGRVTHVRDVDTIEVDGIAIRLNGVDGPELSEPFGPTATGFMRELVHGRYVSCSLNGESNGDRYIGVCFLDGQDIGAVAIASGMALDCRRYSGGRYAHLEIQGAVRRLGGRAGYS